MSDITEELKEIIYEYNAESLADMGGIDVKFQKKIEAFLKQAIKDVREETLNEGIETIGNDETSSHFSTCYEANCDICMPMSARNDLREKLRSDIDKLKGAR